MKCEYRYDMWCKSNPIGKRPPNKIIVMDWDYNSDGRLSWTRLFADSTDSKDYIEIQDNGDIILSWKYENDEWALALQEVLGSSEFYEKTYNEFHNFKWRENSYWAAWVWQMTDDLYRKIIKVYENPTEENKSELSDFLNSEEFIDDNYKILANTSVDYMAEVLYGLWIEKLIKIARETCNYDYETEECYQTIKQLKIGDTTFYFSGQIWEETSEYLDRTQVYLCSWCYDWDCIFFADVSINKEHANGYWKGFIIDFWVSGTDSIINYKLTNRFKKEWQYMYMFYDESEHNGELVESYEKVGENGRISETAGWLSLNSETLCREFRDRHEEEFIQLFRLTEGDWEYEMIPEAFDMIYEEYPVYSYWLYDWTELYRQFEALLLEKYNKGEPILILKAPIEGWETEK